MSGSEKYVEAAAEVLAPHVQVWRIWDHDERAVCTGCDWTSETEGHELSAAWALHMASLALPVIGPLIAEDTRVRMVAAAARTVERETSGLYYCPAAGEVEQHPGGGFDVCCDRVAQHQPLTEAAVLAVWKLAAESIAAAITTAGDERSSDRHHKDDEKRDHGSTRYASYLDAASIARKAQP